MCRARRANNTNNNNNWYPPKKKKIKKYFLRFSKRSQTFYYAIENVPTPPPPRINFPPSRDKNLENRTCHPTLIIRPPSTVHIFRDLAPRFQVRKKMSHGRICCASSRYLPDRISMISRKHYVSNVSKDWKQRERLHADPIHEWFLFIIIYRLERARISARNRIRRTRSIAKKLRRGSMRNQAVPLFHGNVPGKTVSRKVAFQDRFIRSVNKKNLNLPFFLSPTLDTTRSDNCWKICLSIIRLADENLANQLLHPQSINPFEGEKRLSFREITIRNTNFHWKLKSSLITSSQIT